MGKLLEIHHTMGRRIIGIEIAETEETPQAFLVTFFFDDDTSFSIHSDYRFLRCSDSLPHAKHCRHRANARAKERVVYSAGVN